MVHICLNTDKKTHLIMTNVRKYDKNYNVMKAC